MKCKLILEDGREFDGAEILRDSCGGVGIRFEDGSERWFKKEFVMETYEYAFDEEPAWNGKPCKNTSVPNMHNEVAVAHGLPWWRSVLLEQVKYRCTKCGQERIGHWKDPSL